MKLVIAEKPSVGVSIARVLGASTRREGYLDGNEKRTLSMLVETSFYAPAAIPTADDNARITEVLLSNPVLAQQIMQLLQANAVTV